MAKLLGHGDRTAENVGWTGSRRSNENGRRPDQIRGDGEEARLWLEAGKGYEPG